MVEDDFGFSALSEDELKLNVLVEDTRAQELFNAIIPLLNNLRKDCDKAYINWPNRKSQIDDFENKLKKILNKKV